LSENREITFVSQTSYAPFEFINNDLRSDGMSIELARWIATEVGIKANFIDMSFQDAQNAILGRKADILTSFFYSEQRAELFNFTPMVWEVPALIFVPIERPDIKGLEDLQGKTIAMQRGDYAEEFLGLQGINCQIHLTDSFREAIESVISGTVDALIGDKQIVLYDMYKFDYLDELKSVGEPLYAGLNCMATRKDNSILLSILNKSMIRAQKTGTIKRITEKWLGITYREEKSFFVKHLNIILLILLALIILMLVIGLWIFQLRTLVRKKTRELKRNEVQLKIIINTIPDLVWTKNPEGIYLGCNSEFERFFGASEAEIKGKTDYDYIPNELADKFRHNDLEAIRLGQFHMNEESVIYACDGHKAILKITKTPYFDEKGELLGVLGIAHPITERVLAEKKIRENETFLASIIDNIPDMIFVKDAQTHQYLRSNKSAENCLELPESQIVGKKIENVFVEENARKLMVLEQKVLKSRHMMNDPYFIFVKPDGEERIFHWKTVPVFGSEAKDILYILEISRDITEQKRNENLLHRACPKIS